ncbi:MAG: CPBP family intramembrane metalloprotease [Lachnospira sp.]|nr:CPBP family intramembrane metalloprotease [Lachnospira sp.]
MYNYLGAYLPASEENQILSLPLTAFKFFLAFLVMVYLYVFGFCGKEILTFKNTKKSAEIILPIAGIIFIEFIVVFVSSAKNVSPVKFILYLLGLLGIGIFEEFVFRVGVLQILLSKWRNSIEDYEKSAVVCGIFFGAVHLTNILGGNASLYVFGQCVLAAVTGYALSILYIITKNIWGCILFHSIFDSVSTFGLIFGKKAVSDSISSVQYTLGNNSDDKLKDILMVVVFYIVVAAFSAVMFNLGRKLLYFSEKTKDKKDKTKTEIFLEKLLKIEDFPSK